VWQVLLAQVDGTLSQISVNAPSTGFPIGSGFRVNAVQSTQNTSTIYVQSDKFTIVKSNVTSSASAPSSTAYVHRSYSGSLTNLTEHLPQVWPRRWHHRAERHYPDVRRHRRQQRWCREPVGLRAAQPHDLSELWRSFPLRRRWRRWCRAPRRDRLPPLNHPCC
jgi:hypothetical protein